MQDMNTKTPQLRFPEFSGEWIEKRLGEVCEFIKNGYSGKQINKKTEYKVTRIETISEGKINLNKIGYCEYVSSEYLLKKGDILFSHINSLEHIGKNAYINKDFSNLYHGMNLLNIRVKKEQIYHKFLYFALNTQRYKNLFKSLANKAVNQASINQTTLKKIKIHIPPTIKEQQKIAYFLSSIDDKIDIVSKKIEKLKEYKKGLMQKMLNVKNGVPELRFPEFSGKWVERRLGEIAVCEDNKRIPLNENERKQKKGKYPYWGSTKIMDYVDDYIFDGEYVLLSEDGGYFYDYKDKPIAFYVNGKFWANNHIHVLKINKNNNTKFIYYTLAHKNILAYIIGGTRTKLNQKDMLKIKIHIPPTIEEQQKIASFLSRIDEKIELNEQVLDKLKEYKRGLLQKMFV